MKKILVISNYRGYHSARPEAEIFIGLKKRGFDITIMTYSGAEYIERFESEGIHVIPIHPIKRYDKKFISLLKSELVDGNYDILQLFNNKAITNGLQAAKNLPVKIVIYRGASSNMAWYNPFNYLKFFHPRIDYVICNSEEIRQIFLNNPLINSIKPITILKGHDVKWYSDIQIKDVRSDLGVKANSLLLVTVANNRKVKGIDILLKSIKLIPKDVNIDFLIIGEKMDKSHIPSLISNSGKPDRIHLLGFRKDVLNIVSGCSLYICPSIGSEALTKSVMEAMSLGVVPIISDIEGNKPLVDNLENGYIFQKNNPKDLADKIQLAYHNVGNLNKLSKSAKRKIAHNLNSTNTIQAYYNLYREL